MYSSISLRTGRQQNKLWKVPGKSALLTISIPGAVASWMRSANLACTEGLEGPKSFLTDRAGESRGFAKSTDPEQKVVQINDGQKLLHYPEVTSADIQ